MSAIATTATASRRTPRTRRRPGGSAAARGPQGPADRLQVGRLWQVRVPLARGARVEALQAVARQDDDRGFRRRAAHAGDDLTGVGAGHADVEEDDVRLQLGGERERRRAVVRLADDVQDRVGFERVAQERAHVGGVVADEHGRHARPAGSATTIVHPSPRPARARIDPPWRSAMRRAMAMLTPAPAAGPLPRGGANVSNRRAAAARSSARPVSAISIRTVSPSRAPEIAMRPGPGAIAVIAPRIRWWKRRS